MRLDIGGSLFGLHGEQTPSITRPNGPGRTINMRQTTATRAGYPTHLFRPSFLPALCHRTVITPCTVSPTPPLPLSSPFQPYRHTTRRGRGSVSPYSACCPGTHPLPLATTAKCRAFPPTRSLSTRLRPTSSTAPCLYLRSSGEPSAAILHPWLPSNSDHFPCKPRPLRATQAAP
ncbi:hypothetical protein GY45DRAFT_677536 [Cubamyces sp. BRFM 1775]|nr:hypothetical protein GY45DRAFT_677536 [Cubamyces sp. BRFM 1775]